MTIDIERQFFDTFGIETEERFYCKKGYCNRNPSVKENSLNCRECENGVYYFFPEITDRILLELFDILRKYYNLDFWTIDNSFVMDVRDKSASYTNILYRTGGDLKYSILRSLQLIVNQKLNYNENIKQQVQSLFKEG